MQLIECVVCGREQEHYDFDLSGFVDLHDDLVSSAHPDTCKECFVSDACWIVYAVSREKIINKITKKNVHQEHKVSEGVRCRTMKQANEVMRKLYNDKNEYVKIVKTLHCF